MQYKNFNIYPKSEDWGYVALISNPAGIDCHTTEIYGKEYLCEKAAKEWIDNYLGTPHIHDESIIDVTNEPAEKIPNLHKNHKLSLYSSNGLYTATISSPKGDFLYQTGNYFSEKSALQAAKNWIDDSTSDPLDIHERQEVEWQDRKKREVLKVISDKLEWFNQFGDVDMLEGDESNGYRSAIQDVIKFIQTL